MKKLPTFTLVHRPSVASPARKGKSLTPKTGASAQLKRATAALDPVFQQALIASFADRVTSPALTKGRTPAAVRSALQDVQKITSDLARQPAVKRVGILDMGAWLGTLPVLLERLNAAQALFTLFEVQAPMPGGLRKSAEEMADWAAARLGRKLTASERRQFEPQMIADDFFAAAETTRKTLGLDLIVGVTPVMIAGDEDDEVYWNHFASTSGRTLLLSVTDLRAFADQANRPFEAALGVILTAAILVAETPQLEYHDDTGCIFDYNESRVSLARTVSELRIDDQCLRLMSPATRTAGLAMVAALRRLKGPTK